MRPNEIAFFENYLESHPDSAYLPQLAGIYLESGELEQAIDCCRKELTVRPHSPFGHYLWALAALKRGDTRQAVAEFQATIKSDPAFLAAYYQLLGNGGQYLDRATHQLCLDQIRRLNPLDQETIKKYEQQPIGTAEAAISPAPTEQPVVEVTEATQPIPQEPSLGEPTELETAELVETPPSRPVTLPEEEAHLGPLDTELPKEPEPVSFESEQPTAAPVGGAPASLTELFQKFKTRSIDELQQEAAPPPFPEPVVAPAPEPQPKVMAEPPQPPVEPVPPTAAPEIPVTSGAPSDIAKLFEKMRTTPIDELHKEEWIVPPVEAQPAPPAAASTPPPVEPPASPVSAPQPVTEPVTTAPAPETTSATAAATDTAPLQEAKSRRPATKSSRGSKKAADTTSEGTNEITIKFPIPTWTLVEVLKKQGLYQQALEIVAMIEAKSKKAEDLEKARQTRAEIDKLMTEGQA